MPLLTRLKSSGKTSIFVRTKAKFDRIKMSTKKCCYLGNFFDIVILTESYSQLLPSSAHMYIYLLTYVTKGE
jgi:hypothetical protein